MISLRRGKRLKKQTALAFVRDEAAARFSLFLSSSFSLSDSSDAADGCVNSTAERKEAFEK